MKKILYIFLIISSASAAIAKTDGALLYNEIRIYNSIIDTSRNIKELSAAINFLKEIPSQKDKLVFKSVKILERLKSSTGDEKAIMIFSDIYYIIKDSRDCRFLEILLWLKKQKLKPIQFSKEKVKLLPKSARKVFPGPIDLSGKAPWLIFSLDCPEAVEHGISIYNKQKPSTQSKIYRKYFMKFNGKEKGYFRLINAKMESLFTNNPCAEGQMNDFDESYKELTFFKGYEREAYRQYIKIGKLVYNADCKLDGTTRNPYYHLCKWYGDHNKKGRISELTKKDKVAWYQFLYSMIFAKGEYADYLIPILLNEDDPYFFQYIWGKITDRRKNIPTLLKMIKYDPLCDLKGKKKIEIQKVVKKRAGICINVIKNVTNPDEIIACILILSIIRNSKMCPAVTVKKIGDAFEEIVSKEKRRSVLYVLEKALK